MLFSVSLTAALASSGMMLLGVGPDSVSLGATLASFVGQIFTTKEEMSMKNDNKATGKGVLNGAAFTPSAFRETLRVKYTWGANPRRSANNEQ